MTVNERVRLNPLLAPSADRPFGRVLTRPRPLPAPACRGATSGGWLGVAAAIAEPRCDCTTRRRSRRWGGRTREAGAWPHRPRRGLGESRALGWRLL